MHRKHTVNVFRELPDLIYRRLSQVSSMRERGDGEIAAMPASRLPKVIEAWEEPRHAEFSPRTAWSLFNAFSEVQKPASPSSADGGKPQTQLALSEGAFAHLDHYRAIQDGWPFCYPPYACNSARQTMRCVVADYPYEVALSFAGEQRAFVRDVASGLKAAGVAHFFDERSAAEMWGENLPEYLERVYRQQSRFVVVFVSSDYAAKAYPRVEFRSALARAVTEKGAYILPVRFDDTELPGLVHTVSYLDARRTAPDEIVSTIMQKLNRASLPEGPHASGRMPRVKPSGFNPYAETRTAVRTIQESLAARARMLAEGLVGHVEERGERFLLRILRSGRPVYSLDIFLDGGFGENTICFYGHAGGGDSHSGSSNAHGRVEWDSERGRAAIKLSNMSLLADMGREYQFTADELADAIWEAACDEAERYPM